MSMARKTGHAYLHVYLWLRIEHIRGLGRHMIDWFGRKLPG